MKLNADFTKRAVVHAATLDWKASPCPAWSDVCSTGSVTRSRAPRRLYATHQGAVREALSDGIRIAMLLAATPSLAGAGYAEFTICRDEGRPSADARHRP
jgi:hypothetical protein